MKKLIVITCLCFLHISSYAQSIWGGEVVNFQQGTTNLINPIVEERSNPSRAIGSNTNADESNFVSLGFGGSITIKMSEPIRNGEGLDLKIWETTYPNWRSIILTKVLQKLWLYQRFRHVSRRRH